MAAHRSAPRLDPDRLEFARTALQKSALFRVLSPARLEEVASALRPARYIQGQVVFSQGDEGEALYLVESGAVKIFAQSIDGREAIIGEVRAGETFGELVLVDGAPRSATATTVEETILLRLPRQAFNDLLESDAAFRQSVLVALAHELRRATSYLGELHFLDLCGRIASRLAQVAQTTDPSPSGEIRLLGPRSQTDLASMVGGSRQRVNVHLGELVDSGMIRLEGREIVILDLPALERRGQW
jgi:CRP/FNR family cyclic AMP-dependent transcriptional regulator